MTRMKLSDLGPGLVDKPKRPETDADPPGLAERLGPGLLDRHPATVETQAEPDAVETAEESQAEPERLSTRDLQAALKADASLVDEFLNAELQAPRKTGVKALLKAEKAGPYRAEIVALLEHALKELG